MVGASTSELEVKRGSRDSGDLVKFPWLVTWLSWRVNSGHLFHRGAQVSRVQTWKAPSSRDGPERVLSGLKGGQQEGESQERGSGTHSGETKGQVPQGRLVKPKGWNQGGLSREGQEPEAAGTPKRVSLLTAHPPSHLCVSLSGPSLCLCSPLAVFSLWNALPRNPVVPFLTLPRSFLL